MGTEGCFDECGGGSELTLLRNGETVGNMPSGFTSEDFCISLDQMDLENDLFELVRNGSDEVSHISFQSDCNF